VGWLGELHPSIAADLGLPGSCLLFELDITPATGPEIVREGAVSREDIERVLGRPLK
jgi:phenylalanyl-tRNA synthetase beta subunit